MLAQTTQFYLPVVIEVPTLNVSLLLKASARRANSSMPSEFSGIYAVLLVPEKRVPLGNVPLGML
jgi:hypothetical protein